MKIGIISTPFFTVPPKGYSGVEQIVHLSAEELGKLGCDVTVFAPKGSRRSKHYKVFETVEPKYSVFVDWYGEERKAYEYYKERLKDFDVIIDHTWFGFSYLTNSKIMKVVHGHINYSTPPRKNPCFVGVSKFMAKEVEQKLKIKCEVCYNGVDLKDYKFKKAKGERYLFLARMDRFKQPDLAISVCKAYNKPLDVCGEDRFVQDPYYVNEIKEQCDGLLIRYYGRVPHDIKVRLLRNAKALLHVSAMGEPFGLDVIEANACGTPVIAMKDGAIPELIRDGYNGFVCSSIEELEEVIKSDKAKEIEPENCLENAKRFSKERMGKRYLELCNNILDGKEW